MVASVCVLQTHIICMYTHVYVSHMYIYTSVYICVCRKSFDLKENELIVYAYIYIYEYIH